MRTRIKFCGLTHVDDVMAAVALGVDALGFNLYSGSRRFIAPETLASLTTPVPAFVTRVGVFVNPDADLVHVAMPYLDLLQFHGDESADFCARFGKPYMKAVRVSSTVEAMTLADDYPGARAMLIDKRSAPKDGQVVYGGSGETVDWHAVSGPMPMVLAGGLDPENVAAAVRSVRPFAVDVASGIERPDEAAGRKDAGAMHAFVEAVQQADAEK